MSVTGHNKVRSVDDFYETPAWAVRALVGGLGGLTPRARVLDPGIGTGAIAEALSLTSGSITIAGVEMDAGRVEKTRERFSGLNRPIELHCADYLAWAPQTCARWKDPRAQRYDYIIGNPPFSLAMEFVQASMQIGNVVAMLLRLPWLASQGRADWLRVNTPSVFVLPKRPRFVMNVRCGAEERCAYEEVWHISLKRPSCCPGCGGGVKVVDSDATDYGWMVWGRGAPTVKILEVEDD